MSASGEKVVVSSPPLVSASSETCDDGLFTAIFENNTTKVKDLLSCEESDIFPTGIHVVAAIERDNRAAFDLLLEDGRAVVIGIAHIRERLKRNLNTVENGRYAVTPEIILYEDDSPLRSHPSYLAPIVKEMIRPGISMVLRDAIMDGIAIHTFLGHMDAVAETMAVLPKDKINGLIDMIKEHCLRAHLANETRYELSNEELNALQAKVEARLESFRTCD